MKIDLTPRQVAIIGACVRCCIGWTDPRELERFVNIGAEHVREGFTDAEMDKALEALCAGYRSLGPTWPCECDPAHGTTCAEHRS